MNALSTPLGYDCRDHMLVSHVCVRELLTASRKAKDLHASVCQKAESDASEDITGTSQSCYSRALPRGSAALCLQVGAEVVGWRREPKVEDEEGAV